MLCTCRYIDILCACSPPTRDRRRARRKGRNNKKIWKDRNHYRECSILSNFQLDLSNIPSIKACIIYITGAQGMNRHRTRTVRTASIYSTTVCPIQIAVPPWNAGSPHFWPLWLLQVDILSSSCFFDRIMRTMITRVKTMKIKFKCLEW